MRRPGGISAGKVIAVVSSSSTPSPARGHIGGTSHRDLSKSDENHRDLNCRSEDILAVFAPVKGTSAPDPAYRPTRMNT